MNIFVLDLDPARCAQAHCDRHVSKMILEHAQMAATVGRKLGLADVPYKSTHANHPCTLWLGQSADNVHWLYQLTEELNTEKINRFGGVDHKSIYVMRELAPRLMEKLPGYGYVFPFAQALPNDCKSSDAVASYRQYYRIHKTHLHSWSNRERPAWL